MFLRRYNAKPAKESKDHHARLPPVSLAFSAFSLIIVTVAGAEKARSLS